MKLLIALIVSTTLVIGCTPEKPGASKQPTSPRQKVENHDCADSSLTAVRLLSHNPHVPFAIIDKNAIQSAGRPCCEKWAITQAEWFNLNEYGKIVGKSKVTGGDEYDVTQCYELQLETVEGSDGTGLYTSKNVNWELDSTQRWTPTQNEQEKLNAFILDVNKLVIDDKKPNYVDTTTMGKMMFFQIAPARREDGHGIPLTKCVVFGKRYLLVAYINRQGAWTLAHLENEYTNGDYKLYTPIALVDIEKDGIPEIIFQDHLGHAFRDKILKIQNPETLDSWKIGAMSIEGATI